MHQTGIRMIPLIRIGLWFGFGLVFILLSLPAGASGKNSKDEICESMKSGASGGIPIILAGLLHNRLIVVSNDYHVYELKVTSLNKDVDKLYLNTKPIPMATKYPELWNDARFKRTKENMYAAWTAMDHVSDYFCFETKKVRVNFFGVNFDLKQRQVYDGYTYVRAENQPEVQMISSSTNLRFYGLSDMFGHGLAIEKYQFSDNTVRHSKSVNTVEYFKALCFDGSAKSTIFMSSSTDSCPSGSTRFKMSPIPKGFVDKGKFYLFGERDVHIFSEDVVKNTGSKHEVKKVKFNDFFLCQGDYIPPEFEDKTDLGLLFAILLIILLLLLCCCLFIGKRIYDNHKRKQQERNHSKGSAAGSKSRKGTHGSPSGSKSAGSRRGSIRTASTLSPHSHGSHGSTGKDSPKSPSGQTGHGSAKSHTGGHESPKPLTGSLHQKSHKGTPGAVIGHPTKGPSESQGTSGSPPTKEPSGSHHPHQVKGQHGTSGSPPTKEPSGSHHSHQVKGQHGTPGGHPTDLEPSSSAAHKAHGSPGMQNSGKKPKSAGSGHGSRRSGMSHPHTGPSGSAHPSGKASLRSSQSSSRKGHTSAASKQTRRSRFSNRKH